MGSIHHRSVCIEEAAVKFNVFPGKVTLISEDPSDVDAKSIASPDPIHPRINHMHGVQVRRINRLRIHHAIDGPESGHAESDKKRHEWNDMDPKINDRIAKRAKSQPLSAAGTQFGRGFDDLGAERAGAIGLGIHFVRW